MYVRMYVYVHARTCVPVRMRVYVCHQNENTTQTLNFSGLTLPILLK